MDLTRINFTTRMATVIGECPFCARRAIITVGLDAYRAWKAGTLIQDAFPDMTDDQRELLKSGIHPECWPVLVDEQEEIEWEYALFDQEDWLCYCHS